MLTKFKIKYNTGLETELVSSDCHTVDALAMAMFGTDKPDAEITLVQEPEVAPKALSKTAKA